MRTAALLLVVGAIMGMAVVQVMGEEVAKPATLKGAVVKVEDGKVIVKAADKEVTVATDDKTAVTVDGKEAKVVDLKAGMDVVVTPAEGTATKIEATSPKAAEKPAEK